MSTSFTVLKDLSTPIPFKYPDIPIFTKKSFLSLHGYECVEHWHTCLEFFYVYEGWMDVFVNGQVVHVEAGEGIFINSRRLHHHYSEEKNECKYYLLLIDFFAGLAKKGIVSDYFNKKFCLDAVDYLVLHPDVPWESEVMRSVQTVYEIMEKDEPNPLQIIALGCGICANICEHIPDPVVDDSNGEREIFLKMTAFINNHYHEKINLDGIAAAGGVCRSKCCQVFQNQINQSPNNYLVSYRIAKSCELLKSTALSIAEISAECGFHTPSYYISVFQKHTDLTPKAYRIKNNR